MVYKKHMKNKIEQKLLPKLFEIDLNASKLILTAGSTLNDACWGAWFGEVQEILRRGEYNNHSFTSCHVDLSQCYWADPLPLLSLSLSLIEYEQNTGRVKVTFPAIHPNPDSTNPDKSLNPRQKDQARLLKFLVREGFFDLLANPKIVNAYNINNQESKCREIKFGEIEFDSDKDLNLIRELPVSLAFERSTCLQAMLLDLSFSVDKEAVRHLETIDALVEKILFHNIAPVIDDEVPGWAQDSLRYRLMTFLCETLNNVFEHAQTKFAAVYVRYREGALGEAPETWGRLSRFIKREENNHRVPLMKTRNKSESFPNTRTGFFEVFVIDSGIGLCRSLSGLLSGNKINPVHQTMLDVFKRGVSSKKDRPTQYGGLHLIGELLTPSKDYFRVQDEDTWWATQLPLKDEETNAERSEQITLDACGKKYCNKEVRGLAWTARLSWLEAQDVTAGNTPWFGFDKPKDRNNVLKVYKISVDEEVLEINSDILVYDARFSSCQPYEEFPVSLDSSNTTLLFLPPPNLLKNHIQEEIERLLIKPSLSQFENLNLVIGDIPSEEAITYLAAINNAYKFTTPVFKAIERVVLVTRALKVSILQRNEIDKSLKTNHDMARTYVVSNKASGTMPHKSLCDYLHTLRKHDGHRLRSMLTEQSSDLEYMDFLAEEVVWNNELILQGYLDFAQTLTNPLFRAIYSLSLQRLTGFFPSWDCRLESLDSLIHSLVNLFNTQIPPRPSSKGEHRKSLSVQIGSIRVSGYTEHAEKKDENTPVFHFFRHPNGNADGLFLLPWISSAEITKSIPGDKQFRRVGKTPVIARDGWKAYPIHRFYDIAKDKFDSPYEKTPKDSYRAWQEPSRPSIKLGHWSYGGHHEIFTINLLLAFNTELDRISLHLGGSLARFTYANFFRIFGITEKDLKRQNKALFNKIKEDNYRNLLSTNDTENSLLVYSSHPVTDHIITQFLELLENDVTKKIRSELIAISPIKRHRSGSGLQISGITLERLKIKADKNVSVIFFDDGVISGRTYEEIKRLLRSLGFRNISSLILLDRQRLPSIDHLENKKHVCYWRWDVPSLGGKAHCPLCHAIERVKALSDSIVSKAHKMRIDSWCDSWKEIDPSTGWGDAGLRPIPLTLKKPERKFSITRNSDGSYSQIGGEKQQIRLTNSAGLISWVTELHSLTSRDDLSLRLIETEKDALSPEVRIQLLSSQLLLFYIESDPDHARDMGGALLEALWDSKIHNRHTALAALTLISCGDTFLKRIMDKFLNSNRLYELKEKNVDFILLTTLMLSVARRDSTKLEENQEFDVASRLLKPCDKSDLYYRLHREIKDALGKAHSSPLNRVVSTSDSFVTPRYLMNVQGSAAQVLALINEIPRYSLHSNSLAHKEYIKITANIFRKEEELREAIKKHKHSSETDTFIEEVKEKGRQLLTEGNKFHSGLFYPLKIQKMRDGSLEAITELKESIESALETDGKIIKWHLQQGYDTKLLANKLIEKNSEINEAYIVWDTETREAVLDILSNVRHVEIKDKIDNPWKYKQEQSNKKAHLWCQVDMDHLWFKFVMRNKSKLKSQKIKKETINTHSHHILNKIGGKVVYQDKNGDQIETSVAIPYAHTLQTLPKEKPND